MVLLQHNIPISLTFSATTSTHLESSEAVVCSSEYAVHQFILSLQDPMNMTQSVPCGGNFWKVRLCNSNQPAVCVNCIDPCDNVVCSGLNPFFISPCQTHSTSCPEEAFYSRYLNISFVVKDSIPLITSSSSIESGTAAVVQVSLTSDAYVTCGAIPDGYPVIDSDVMSIIYEQHQIVPTVNKQATLIVSNLQPLTTYTLLCIPEGFSGFLTYLGAANDFRCIMRNILTGRKLSTIMEDSILEIDLQVLPPLVSEDPLIKRRLFSSSHNLTTRNSAIRSTSISTTCCYLLYVQLNRIFIYQRTDQINILTISSNYPTLTKAVVVKVSIVSQETNASVLSETIYFSEKDLLIAVQISLSRYQTALVGNYSISVSVNSSDYTVSYKTERVILQIFSENTVLSPPHTFTAMLLPSTSEILVEFDSPTNRARIITSTFVCAMLLTFAGSEKTLCSWMDDSSFRIFLRRDSTILPGHRIALNGTMLRAPCTVGNELFCDSWPAVGIQSINITLIADTESYVPVVVINAPEIIAIFSDVYLDVTSSLGHGSRPWDSINFRVFSNSNASSAIILESFLNRNYRIFPPSAIPSALTYTGMYNIVVRLCNFLGFCSFASHSITIIRNYYPQVTIAGLTSLTVFNDKNLHLTSLARVYTMYGGAVSVSSRNMSFLWTISQSNTKIRQLYSPAYTRHEFSLPAYSLTPNLFYSVTVTVMSEIYLKLTSATVQVFVKKGKVVARIGGGGQQWVKEGGGSLDISAAASFIEDLSPGVSLSVLSFTWSCFQYFPFYSAGCSLSLAIAPCGYNVTVTTTSLSSNTSSTITVLVSDGVRYATSSVGVRSYADSRPVVAIDTVNVGKVVNPTDTFILSATVAVEQSSMIECSLSVNDTSVNISSSTYSSPKLALNVNNIARSFLPIHFGVVPSMFGYFHGLRFTVSCVNDQRSTAMNFIDIAMNQPPTAGTMMVSPPVGVELTDVFSMSASGWYDVDMPLSFAFGYIDEDNLTQCLQYRSGRAYGYSKLARIDSSTNSRVSIVVSVYDAIDAWSLATSSVSVVQSSIPIPVIVRNFIDNQAFIDTALSNLDTQLVVLGTTFLNNHPQIIGATAEAYRFKIATKLFQLTTGYSDGNIRSAWLAALLSMSRPAVDQWVISFEPMLSTLDFIVQQSASSDFSLDFQEKVFMLVNRFILAISTDLSLSTDTNFNTIRQAWSILNMFGLRNFISGQRGSTYDGGYFQSVTVAKYLTATGVNSISSEALFLNGSLAVNITNYVDAAVVRLSVSSYPFRDVETNLSTHTSLKSISSSATLQFDDPSFCISNNCTTTLVFNNYQNQSYNGNRSEVVSTYCIKGLVQYFTYPCDSGLNYTVYCDGLHSGYVNSFCPYVIALPICYIEYYLNETSVNRAMCTVNEFTNSYTVCKCSYSQMASIPVTALGFSFSVMKFIERHSTLFFSSASTKSNIYPVISLLMVTTIDIDGPVVSELLGTKDSSFISDLFYSILPVPGTVVRVTGSKRTSSSTSISVNVTANFTTSSFCTEEKAGIYYKNALQSVPFLYNSRIPYFIARNNTVLQNSTAITVATVLLRSRIVKTSALQNSSCRDMPTYSPTSSPISINQNAVALKSLSSASTNFVPFDFAMTYSLALTLFFVISAFYFYLYSTTRIDFIDKRMEKLFPISPLELPKASAKVLTPKTPSQMIHSQSARHGSDVSVDIQYSNLFSLSSEFEHRNRRRQRLKDSRNNSNYSLWDRHMGSAISSSPIAHTAATSEDRPPSLTAASAPRQGIQEEDDDADTVGTSVQQQEVTEMPMVNQSDDRGISLEPLNNLSFYNGECSVTGLLEDNDYDFDDITMMSNPFKGSHRNDPDNINMAVYKNDTTILFGNQQTDEGNQSETSNTGVEATAAPEEGDVALDRRLSAKRKLGYYLNKLSPPKPSASTANRPSLSGISIADRDDTASQEGSRDSSFISSPTPFLSAGRRRTANTEESSPVRNYDDPLVDINLTRRQTLSYYMKKLDPAPMSFRKRLSAPPEASSKDNNKASNNPDVRLMSLVKETNDTSRRQELDEDR